MEVDLKGATGINKSALVSKTDLASLKTKVDNLDVDKLKTVPASDFIKLSNVVDNNVVKKNVYDKKLATKVNFVNTNISSTSGLVIKTQYDWNKQALEKKINDVNKKILITSWLFKKTNYHTKITEIGNKITDITYVATKAALIQKPQKLKVKYLTLLI